MWMHTYNRMIARSMRICSFGGSDLADLFAAVAAVLLSAREHRPMLTSQGSLAAHNISCECLHSSNRAFLSFAAGCTIVCLLASFNVQRARPCPPPSPHRCTI